MHHDIRTTAAPDRRYTPGTYAWTGAAALILLGAIFLLHNAGVLTLAGHWWAVFILIPAATTAATAWTQYQAGGRRLTPAVGGSLVASAVLATVAAIFLLNLAWGTVWPIFLIIAGLAALLQRAHWPRGDGSMSGL